MQVFRSLTQESFPVRQRAPRSAVLLAASLSLAGCASGTAARHTAATTSPPASTSAAPAALAAPSASASAGTQVVGALAQPRLRPDVLVSAGKTLTPIALKKVAALVPGSVTYTTGLVHVAGHPVQVASVDPVTFRRFTAAGTAESTAVWQAVARGDVIVSHALAKSLHLTLGGSTVVVGRTRPSLRIGALATTGIPGTDLVVDTATGEALGLGAAPTAVLLNAGTADPASLASRVRTVTGSAAIVDLLSQPASDPTAFLTGSKAAKAFGAFSYQYFPDGTIQPDAAWVKGNIESATVPILGRVTCHRLMVPQLRGALEDVVKAGLAGSIHTYDGCYVPRFIERNPTHAISLHTWGIAIDIDAATNGRGTVGTMDPRVVAIFKHWGFIWGGDWHYTDPMHFEIGALLTTP